MTTDYNEAEHQITDASKKQKDKAVTFLFGQKLQAKLEFEYTYQKKLNYFEGVPRVARPKIQKREVSSEKAKQDKIKFYVEKQEDRGYYVEEEKKEILDEIDKRKKREAIEAEKKRRALWH